MLFSYGVSSLLVDYYQLNKKLLFCLYLADCVCQMKVPHKLIKDYFLLCPAFLSSNTASFFSVFFMHDLLREALLSKKNKKQPSKPQTLS